MNFDQLRSCCLEKPGAFEDWPFGPETLVIKVSTKMFALFGMSEGVPSISLKCDPIVAVSLRAQHPQVTGAYHMNKEHWNTVVCNHKMDDEVIRWMIAMSYDLVRQSLSKKQQTALQYGII